MGSSDKLSPRERRRQWLEVSAMYLAMAVLTVVSIWVEALWVYLAGVGALVVALGFMMLPTELLHRRGESPHHFGIGGRADLPIRAESSSARAWRSTRQAIKISLIILPAYWVATHLWHQAQGRDATWDQRALTRWSDEVRGVTDRPLPLRSASLEARADHIKLRWRLRTKDEIQISLLLSEIGEDSTLPYRVIGRSAGARVTTLPGDLVEGDYSKGARGQTKLEIRASQSGWVTMKTTARAVQLSAMINRQRLPESQLLGGEHQAPLSLSPSGLVTARRSDDWLWSIFLIQLFMVGLPEEIFYRGYLQTRLDGLIGRDRQVFGASFNWMSALLCSALFAVAHLITVPHPARLAVFFPSLLFGWMRRAYHDTLSPAIFHALCNVSAQVSWGIYALG